MGYKNIAEINEKLSAAAPILDKKVVTPNAIALRKTVSTMYGPTMEAADPYITAVRPCVTKVEPYAKKGYEVLKKVGMHWFKWVVKVESKMEEELRPYDKGVGQALRSVDANEVYEVAAEGAV